ncbi:NAD(P)/FAD-dependent oxidoreductase [Mesonia sp.]|uniref:NAD(P)/FAD-dependent oxidoreductase n=1 Tax=Mesonia sp. TaxID=1960830 RepID=UPI003F97D282
MSRTHFDAIVVGFGLSGLSVSKRLEENNKKILIISEAGSNASKVAGGVFNPVVLKKFNLAWNSQELYENAVPFYQQLQEQFQENLFSEKSILRIFKSAKEQNDWFSALGKPVLDYFLSEDLKSNTNPSLNAPYKMGVTKHTALLETSKLLKAYERYLKDKDWFLDASFQYNQLILDNNRVQYKDYSANHIIFCEGASVNANPYFGFLPIQGNKGEYISIKAKDLQLNEMVKGSFFIIPQGKDIYKFGATYSRDFLDDSISVDARTQLEQKLKEMITCDFEVIDQEAGIRPTVPDRKPILGQHPKHSAMYICNGFGSRGILFAPTLSKQLVEAIFSDKEIPKEINVSRFYDDFEAASSL